MFTINLETIKSGIRVTARHRGTTQVYRDGQIGSEKELIAAVMTDACGAHRKGDGSFDMTYITLNDAAAKAVA